VADIFLPALDELAFAGDTEQEVEGTLVTFSDSGTQLREFAVVDVVWRRSVVVPVGKLLLANGE
jgi:hypothetical protein